ISVFICVQCPSLCPPRLCGEPFCLRLQRVGADARVRPHFSPGISIGTDMPLDRAAVAHIATLARINVPETELDARAKDPEGTLPWGERLREVDPAKVEPMTGAVRMALPRRKDEITDGDCRDKILANGPETAHGFFVVPKVVE